MQRQDFAVPNQSFLDRRQPAFAVTNDSVGTDSGSPDFLREDESEPRRPLRRSIGWMFGCAVLGVGLAFAWRYVDLQHLPSIPSVHLWAASATQPETKTTASTTASVDQQIAHLTQQVEGLAKKTEDLANTQQQLAATIASLQAGQQDFAKRLAATPPVHAWYSEPATLREFTWTPARSTAANEHPHPVKPAVRKDEHARAPERGKPLSLTSPGQ